MLFDTAGTVRRIVGGILDRTESLEAEAKLRRTLGLLEEAQRFAQLGSWRFDPSSGELEWSHEFRRIAGLPPDVDAQRRALPGARGARRPGRASRRATGKSSAHLAGRARSTGACSGPTAKSGTCD